MLTPRELRVLQLVAAGLSNDEVGYSLGVTEATVKAQVSSMLRKLCATNRAQLVAIAVGRGIVQVQTGTDDRAKTALPDPLRQPREPTR